MTKKELIDAVAARSGETKVNTGSMINHTIESIKDVLAKGEKVSIVDFLTISVKDVDAREARNPRTGETIDVPAKKSLRFSASKSLKNYINE